MLAREGPARAHALLEKLIERSRRKGVHLAFSPTTAYVNTIPVQDEAKSPGDHALEWKIRSIIRWNALAMVVNSNRDHAGIGGHIATFQSAATLYDVGFNHFWKGPDHPDGADLIYMQGHCTPGIYARAFLEGRLSEEDLKGFRMEADGKGLSSYPHTWLMPEFWQFATVSMGLGPIQAIYQARLMKYLENRGLMKASGRKVWCFCGDGEMDEPESLGAIDIADREQLDNLVFVVNCNLQRLDGPVRGNGENHPGARRRLPRRRLERHQGGLGRAARPALRRRQGRHAGQGAVRHGRRRIPELHPPRGQVHPRVFREALAGKRAGLRRLHRRRYRPA